MTTDTASSTDFGQECREAFLNHCRTRAQINPEQWAARISNQRRRAQIVTYIDDLLDVFNEWQRISLLDFPAPPDVHIERGND